MPTKHTAATFQVGDRIHLRAQQVWVILVACTMMHRTLTYGELARLMGYDTTAARTTIKPLAIIAKFCLDHGLPQLNALVVNAETGEPGHHVILKAGETSQQARQMVFDFDWFSLRVPSPGHFRAIWENWS